MRNLWKISTMLLAATLLLTNLWWIHGAIDAGTKRMYKDQLAYEQEGILKQLLATIPELSSCNSKNEILVIMQRHSDLDSFEKDGAIWIGWLGLKFNDQGKLINVLLPWDPVD